MHTPTRLRPTPKLSDDMILRAVCGLRPCRRGGLRIEHQRLGGKHVVHNYGHGGCGVTTSFGTAEIAADLVGEHAEPGAPVAVLGAGVVGLVTARELLHRGHKPTLYAHRVALDTTSVLAGALWLPVGIEFGTSDEALRRKDRILRRSRLAFAGLDPERYGVQELPVYEPHDTATEEGLFAPGLIEEPVAIDRFPFACAAAPGRVFSTAFIHTPRFLSALVHDLRQAGVEFIDRRFEGQQELRSLDEPVLVNCLALGSRELFGDDRMYAARGVLVHMQPQDLGYCVHNGYKYMFPREDALILGGCFQEDRWDPAPDDAMIHEVLTHHRRFFGQA